MYTVNTTSEPTTREPTALEAAALLDELKTASSTNYRFVTEGNLIGTYNKSESVLCLRFIDRGGDLVFTSVKFAPVEISPGSGPDVLIDLARRYLERRSRDKKPRYSVLRESTKNTVCLYSGDDESTAAIQYDKARAKVDPQLLGLTLFDREGGTIRHWSETLGDRHIVLDPVAARVAVSN